MGDVDELIASVVSSRIRSNEEVLWIFTLELNQHQQLAF
jgi:hypothetical protein